jgi:hypothetical protein
LGKLNNTEFKYNICRYKNRRRKVQNKKDHEYEGAQCLNELFMIIDT